MLLAFGAWSARVFFCLLFLDLMSGYGGAYISDGMRSKRYRIVLVGVILICTAAIIFRVFVTVIEELPLEK